MARRDAVLIGPAASLIGSVMAAHEFGGRFRGRQYPKRPLMGPSLEQSKQHLPALLEEVIAFFPRAKRMVLKRLLDVSLRFTQQQRQELERLMATPNLENELLKVLEKA